ncbi:DUF3883 domain-containing protein [Rhodococcus koreensis]|uniref:DUF3883 domain-containing protein n=1 Tax=Rhodococcus koreensis TaxID=99653 RepID=UPI0036DDC5A1
MPIPPEPILRAALRWMERIPDSGVQRVRSLLTTNISYGDLTPTQYETALRWLETSGLLTSQESSAPAAVRLFEHAVAGASWFPEVDDLIRDPDELPVDAINAAQVLNLGIDEAYQHLVNTWGKVDTTERGKLGAAGEAELVTLLRSSLSATVEHVAAWSDGLGYDISVSGHDASFHLEVKSSTRPRRCMFYLSRNEFEVMKRDPHWSLVFVRLSPEYQISAISTVRKTWIRDSAPLDTGPEVRWASCRFDAPFEKVDPGIPDLFPLLRPEASGPLQSALAAGSKRG